MLTKQSQALDTLAFLSLNLFEGLTGLQDMW